MVKGNDSAIKTNTNRRHWRRMLPPTNTDNAFTNDDLNGMANNLVGNERSWPTEQECCQERRRQQMKRQPACCRINA